MFDFISFVRRKWAEYSESSGQKGTAIDELAVKPTGLVLSDFYNLMVQQRRINNIQQWEQMTDEELNFFGNKFFIPRITGDYAFGSVRIWFDEKKEFTLSSESRVVNNDNLRYRFVQPGKITRGMFRDSSDRFGLYYIDFPIVAVSKGTAYNVEVGEISQVINIDFTYKTVSNMKAITSGSKEETNQEYYDRLLYSINDRSMMNMRSLIARLPEFFPVITSIYVAGSGNRYMTRDLVSSIIDISEQNYSVDFLGKVTGEIIIPNSAYYGIFPPVPGTNQGDIYGPNSVTSNHMFWLTIEPSIDNQTSDIDPAFFGFPLDQEATQEMYRGLYFDEFKKYMEVATESLFDIVNEDVGFTQVITPDNTWVYGKVGRQTGDFGMLADGVSASDVLSFNNTNITLSGGADGSISVQKDILKRTGVKLKGSFTWPAISNTTKESNLQMMVGGINESFVDGYTGVGFGIRVVDDYSDSTTNNAIIYFAHSEKYDTGQIFASSADFNDHINATNLGAIAEKEAPIEGGQEYEFEFVLHDDLSLTLYLYRADGTADPIRFELPGSVLQPFNTSDGIKAANTTRYGTMMKITLDTESIDSGESWVVSNLEAEDINPRRAVALFALDVSEIESPLDVYLRAFGSSSVGGLQSDGYRVFIWDKNITSVASGDDELTNGGWSELSELSNSDGSKDVKTRLISTRLNEIDRHRVKSRLGDNIFILVTSTGAFQPKFKYNGHSVESIMSWVRVDYIKIESSNSSAYHSNNKADLYLTTFKNSETVQPVVNTVQKNSSDTYFELSEDNGFITPIMDVITVVPGESIDTGNVLDSSEYSVVKQSIFEFDGSVREKQRLYLTNSNNNTVSIEYRPYPQISDIDGFFNSSMFQKVFGDFLVKHKFPVELSFTVYYTGNATGDRVIEAILDYFDKYTIDGTFIIRDMVSYLYNLGIVNNVKEPITVEYTKYDDRGYKISGEFDNQITIRPIDFFRVAEIAAEPL